MTGGLNQKPGEALVRPRGRLADGGDVLPVDELVRMCAGDKNRGAINIFGAAGTGKTTTLKYLSTVSPTQWYATLLDEPEEEALRKLSADGLVVFTSVTRVRWAARGAIELEPWSDEDLIEYLLKRHPAECESVMKRVLAMADRGGLGGVPELWTAVLEAMAGDVQLRDLRGALGAVVRSALAGADATDIARACLADLQDEVEGQRTGVWDLTETVTVPMHVRRLIRHRAVELLVAGDQIVRDIAREDRDYVEHDLALPLPSDLIRDVGGRIRGQQQAMQRLAKLADRRRRDVFPGAISLLVAADPSWRPVHSKGICLAQADLSGAQWAGLDLRSAKLREAKFEAADLSESNLKSADAGHGIFRTAALRKASIRQIVAAGADFSRADLCGVSASGADLSSVNLSGAKLREAELVNADLRGANLSEAVLDEADLFGALLESARIEGASFRGAKLLEARLLRLRLTQADFAGASFRLAKMDECDLEGMVLSQADFRGAWLHKARLTGSTMPWANFEDANLTNTGLAEIEWENANLRGADLRRCSFHMGSSRSGLVLSTIASEGTRTGFYTDDYNDQDFKAPEEIRKANLRGADLRGANIDGVDFYLVDLRGATFSPDQREHLARCGAILDR